MKAQGQHSIEVDSILPKLKQIEADTAECCKKTQNSGKFIKYFVHDILDFSILRNDGSKFVKDLKVFDVRDTIQEIIEIQEDKAALKDIKVEMVFRGFEELHH